MKRTIQRTEAWSLDAELQVTDHGNVVRFISFVPHARRPERQVKFQLILTDEELKRLQRFFHLSEAVADATI